MEYDLNNQLSRNFQNTLYIDRQIVPTQAVGLSTAKRDINGLTHLAITTKVLMAIT